MKKPIILLLMMLLPMVAGAEPVLIDGIYYEFVSEIKEAIVTSNPNKYKGNVVIPASVTYNGAEYRVTSIGNEAFWDCTSIMSVESYIAEPFNVTGLFADETYRQGTLYVPKGTKDIYIRYDGWRDFLKIEEMGNESAPNGQCATPNIMIAGKAFKFSCDTPSAEFESILTTEEHFTGDELPMENREIVYTLTVYATAPGYDRSEPAKISFVIDRNDVNQDGKVDVADIATILTRMAAQARVTDDVEE